MRRFLLVLLIFLALLASGCGAEEGDASSSRNLKEKSTLQVKINKTPWSTATVKPTLIPSTTVLAASTEIHSGPSPNFSVIGEVHKGDILEVEGENLTKTWLKIKTSTGETGWINTQHTNLPFRTGRTTSILGEANKNANLRAGPGTNYPRVGGVKAGDDLQIIGQLKDGSWYKLASGAWIAAFLVSNASSGVPVVTDIPTPPPASIPKPAQPTGKSSVQIVGMLRDGKVNKKEPDEYVEIANLGNAPQNMTGWKLVSERRGNDSRQIFHFPDGFTLNPGQHCRIYTNEYHPEYCGLSFGHGRGAVWSNSKPDAALLVDSHGNVVSRLQ